MPAEKSFYYEFDHFCVDPLKRLLFADGNTVPLPPKAFDLLLVLIQNHLRILKKEELMGILWDGTTVEESNLTQTVFLLRRALGENAHDHRYIVTVPRVGYRFVSELRRVTTASLACADRGSETTLSGGRRVVRYIAVLPFRSVSADSSGEYLALGMADALTVRLGAIRHLRVRPVSAAFKLGPFSQDLGHVGRKLRVDFLLSGTLRCSGKRVRITVQIVDVRAGLLRWSSQFEQHVTDIFTFQDTIAERIVLSLPPELTAGEQCRTQRYTDNREASLKYLKGRYFWNKRTPQGFQKAVQYFRQAIKRDPDDALAWAGLADCYSLLACYNIMVPMETWPQAKAAAVRALEIDNSLAEAHATLALVRIGYEWDWPGAERECQRALALNPAYATAHDYYAEYWMALGQHQEAISSIRRAQELEPLSLIINCDVGCNLFRARLYDEAAEQLCKTVDLDPSFALAHWSLGWVCEAKGMSAKALIEFGEASRLFDNGSQMLASIGHLYAVSGNRRRARTVLNQLARQTNQRYVSPYDLAILCTGLGEKDQAFDWLDRACQERPFDLVYLKVEPRLDPLRSDPRFESLLRRMCLHDGI